MNAAQLQNQAREGVEYRFGVILKQRVRYAALTALITTVEWCLISLKKRASFDFPNNDVNENEAVYILKVFNNKMKLELESKVLLIQKLIQVRNCIVHAAGLLESCHHKKVSNLRQSLESLHGVKASNINFLGESIEIEYGFLEGVIGDVRKWLPYLEKSAIEQGLLI